MERKILSETPIGSDALFRVSCPSCGGIPYVSRDGRDHCEQCAGTGKIVEREQVTEMRLCELRFVGLRPDQLYRFTVDPNCPKCVEDAKPYASESSQNVKGVAPLLAGADVKTEAES